jgi:hypothetical protein
MRLGFGMTNYEIGLERSDKLDRKHTSFLCEILRARPIACLTGLTRLSEEAADFFYQIVLRGAQLLVIHLLEVFFGYADIVIGLALVACLIAG